MKDAEIAPNINTVPGSGRESKCLVVVNSEGFDNAFSNCGKSVFMRLTDCVLGAFVALGHDERPDWCRLCLLHMQDATEVGSSYQMHLQTVVIRNLDDNIKSRIGIVRWGVDGVDNITSPLLPVHARLAGRHNHSPDFRNILIN